MYFIPAGHIFPEFFKPVPVYVATTENFQHLTAFHGAPVAIALAAGQGLDLPGSCIDGIQRADDGIEIFLHHMGIVRRKIFRDNQSSVIMSTTY